MAEEALHPNVAFAKRYGESTDNYLNAYVALVRMDSLVEDAASLKEALENEVPPERRWAPWYGAEAFSYYAVGYVTCFEWHARSRIADLFSYAPTCLKPDDLKGQISEKVMVKMLAEGASVARLLAASVSVGSFKRYMQIMTRVFAETGVPDDPYAWLKKADPDRNWSDLESFEFENLEDLFNFRNELVHEIGIGIIGHPNIRNNWTPEVALTRGRLAHAVMRRLEGALRIYAPRDFPNLLGEDGFPDSTVDRLNAEVAKLEAVLNAAIGGSTDFRDSTKTAWLSARDAARRSHAEQLEFIENADFLGVRYIDLRTRLKLEVAQARIRYLKMLLDDVAGESGEPVADRPLGA